MRFLGHLLLMVAVALGLGFGLSYYALTDGRLFGARAIGPWTAWTAVGSPNPDPYTRAYLSRRGELQLGQSEGIRFTADTDSDGHRLRADCSYRIDGQTPLAAFWTLVAVNPAGENIAAGTLLYLDSLHLSRAADGSIEIGIGQSLMAGDWLEISGDGPFRLVLTLYDSSVFSGLGTGISGLPAILNAGCS